MPRPIETLIDRAAVTCTCCRRSDRRCRCWAPGTPMCPHDHPQEWHGCAAHCRCREARARPVTAQGAALLARMQAQGGFLTRAEAARVNGQVLGGLFSRYRIRWECVCRIPPHCSHSEARLVVTAAEVEK